VSIWQAGYAGAAIPLLAVLGTVVALLRPAWRPAVALSLAAFGLLFISAALVGNVSRYRYPTDPFLAVLAVGALAWIAAQVRARAGGRAAAPTRGQSTMTPVLSQQDRE
ncbi:MAG: hypothetical protein AB7P40_27880, partial [Chloroflexota bacterium]